MPRTNSSHPVLAWSEFARKQSEMLLAAGQVIPIRLARMAVAGPQPSRRDRREFSRMGNEKVHAGVQSMLGVAVKMQLMQLQWWSQAWQHWMRAATALAGAAQAPFHAGATANARRLGRVTGRGGAARR
ncbi:MAG TPA: hypothetical protein VEA40_25595 [Ramlibacter sp.]|nr:hypothetical protein [Ramlibacter sp.]